MPLQESWHHRRVSTPRTVDRAFETALYDTADDALDRAASLLAADPAADAELARRGEEFVATAWRRGWQPADLMRIGATWTTCTYGWRRP